MENDADQILCMYAISELICFKYVLDYIGTDKNMKENIS